MPETIYVPRHDTQYEPRTKASPFDCNMAAAADGLRFATLGLVDRNHDELRRLSGTYWEVLDSNPLNDGTNIEEAETVLDHYGLITTAYTAADGRGFSSVRTAIAAGKPCIIHGDYGSVPRDLRGPIDRTFTGLHSVLGQRRAYINGEWCIRIGDGLSDPWRWWPESVVERYMRDFPGTGYVYLTITPRRLAATVAKANVRAKPTRSSAVIRSITPRSRIHRGGYVKGETINGNPNWHKVYSAQGGIGYVHASVGKVAA